MRAHLLDELVEPFGFDPGRSGGERHGEPGEDAPQLLNLLGLTMLRQLGWVGSVVEHNETQDAVAAGILDGHITDMSYFSGKDAAFGLVANPVGAWAAPDQMLDFIENGGGRELISELLEPYGLHFIGATTPAEVSVA